MSQVQDRIQEEQLNTQPKKSLSELDKVTLVALLGNALVLFADLLIIWLLHSAFVPVIFLAIVPSLIAAGLVAGRRRWAPAIGVGAALLTLTLLLGAPKVQYTLVHPASGVVDYIADVLILAFVLVIVLVGVRAATQNYRHSQPQTPRLLRSFLVGLSGLVAGMILLALVVSANPVMNNASSASTGEPTVHMTVDTFAQNVVLVPKGSKLLIINDSSVEHILQNGMWTNGAPRTVTEPGAPVLHNIDIKGGSVEIGPFTTAGTYHIYCTIHQDMNLTIVVQ